MTFAHPWRLLPRSASARFGSRPKDGRSSLFRGSPSADARFETREPRNARVGGNVGSPLPVSGPGRREALRDLRRERRAGEVRVRAWGFGAEVARSSPLLSLAESPRGDPLFGMEKTRARGERAVAAQAVGEDLAHEREALAVDALGRAEDGRAARDVLGDLPQVPPAVLNGHRVDLRGIRPTVFWVPLGVLRESRSARCVENSRSRGDRPA